MDRTFRFREFSINDGQCAMKLTSDAVIFGALAQVKNARLALDIGTGCGILALMIAMQSPAEIHAVEIDHDSAMQARENANASPWAGRIVVHHADIRQFCSGSNLKFDVIVSNPPYFSNSLPNSGKKNPLARHDLNLDYSTLCDCAGRLLTPGGSFSVIIPCNSAKEMIRNCMLNSLYCEDKIMIVPVEGQTPNRCILRFSREASVSISEHNFVLRKKNGEYSPEYFSVIRKFHADF